MTGAEAEGLFVGRKARFEVAAGRHRDAVAADDEASIKLGEFFEGFACVGVVNAAVVGWMSGQRVEDEASTACEHVVFGTDGEEGSDLASLATLACDLDGEIDDRLDG
jgi:hypothetical protein